MKDHVPDGFVFNVPRHAKKYTEPVDHATHHSIPLVDCMREVLAEVSAGR